MKYILTLLIATLLAFSTFDVNATNTTCPPGQVKKEVSGHWKCVDETPTTPTPSNPNWWQDQTQEQTQAQQQDQNQHQTATGTGTGVGLGVGVGLGGNGGQGGNGGAGGSSVANAQGGAGGNAQGGDSTSLSNATGGAVRDSGNSSNLNANTVATDITNRTDIDANNTNLNANNVQSDNRNNLTNTGGNSTNTLSNGSNSGGNSLQNGSASSSGAYSGASNGDQATNVRNDNASAASADGSGNSETTVAIDSSDRSSFESQSLFLPTIQAAPPSIVAGATAIVDRGVCGPRQGLVTEDVNGIYLGLFGQTEVYLGKTDRIASIGGQKFEVDRGQDGVTRLIGHRKVSYIAVIGVAGSRSIGLGGGETGGNWGQAGASGGSSMQRMVVQTDLEDCEYAHTAPVPVVIEAPAKIRE